jgi:hypothetical protein
MMRPWSWRAPFRYTASAYVFALSKPIYLGCEISIFCGCYHLMLMIHEIDSLVAGKKGMFQTTLHRISAWIEPLKPLTNCFH